VARAFPLLWPDRHRPRGGERPVLQVPRLRGCRGTNPQCCNTNHEGKVPIAQAEPHPRLGAARSSVGHLMFDELVCDSGQFTHQGVILKWLVCDLGGFTHQGVKGERKRVNKTSKGISVGSEMPGGGLEGEGRFPRMRKVAGARHQLILPNNCRAKYPSRKLSPIQGSAQRDRG